MKHSFEAIPGWFEFRAAYDEVLDRLPTDRPSVVVELGTFLGRSAAYLGVELVNRRLPTTLVLVDHFVAYPEQRRDFDANLGPIRAALGACFVVLSMRTVEAARVLAGGTALSPVDAVWVDAGHGYADVAADLAAWWPILRPGGVMGGDDWAYGQGDVARAAQDRFGPGRAVPSVAGAQPGELLVSGAWPWWWIVKPAGLP